MLNDYSPLRRRQPGHLRRPPATTAHRGRGRRRRRVHRRRRRRRRSPSTTGSPLIDPGAGSQIRILGIGGNQTTGQQRVPVIITSLQDTSVGVTVRGVQEFKIYNNDPLINPATRLFNPNTPAAPGDGGYIYFGGNSLTDYNLRDPRDGSLIDNADIRT